MDFKAKYLIAKKNGQVERFRGDEISRRISKAYPLSAQIDLLIDKDVKPTEWQTYQDFRANIKAEVDKEIETIEAKTT